MLTTDQWITLAETESTNSLLLEGFYPSGTMVTARRQTAGRGRQGRPWKNTENQSFLYSLLLEFDRWPDAISVMPLMAGLAVLEAAQACLRDLYPAALPQTSFFIKWPNDILIQRENRIGKVAGILLESRMEKNCVRVVTGIGLNWSAVPRETAPAHFPPAALFPDDFPQAKEPEQFIVWLLSALNRYHYDQPAFTAEIREAIEDRFFLTGRMLRGSFGTAVCKGLSAEGMLLLERDDGTVIKYDRTDEEYEIL
jgi:BirA family biotin operon repressor/biotin-[acetyl-CoA-carboxylase] ligase